MKKLGVCTRKFPCTLSCGYTFIDIKHQNSATEILRQADKALYQVKEAGRDKVIGL